MIQVRIELKSLQGSWEKTMATVATAFEDNEIKELQGLVPLESDFVESSSRTLFCSAVHQAMLSKMLGSKILEKVTYIDLYIRVPVRFGDIVQDVELHSRQTDLTGVA